MRWQLAERVVCVFLTFSHRINKTNACNFFFFSVCSNSSSSSTKFDPELLRADLLLAKDRVFRLKKEMKRIQTEMTYTKRGVDTLFT